MSNSLPNAKANRNPSPGVDAVWFTKSTLTFDLHDGRSISVPLSFYTPLLTATDAARLEYEIHGGSVFWSAVGLKLTSQDLLSGRRKKRRSRA